MRLFAHGLMAVLVVLVSASPAAALQRGDAERFRAAIRDYIPEERQREAVAEPAARGRREAVAATCPDVLAEGRQRQLPVVERYYHYWVQVPVDEAVQPAVDGLVARLRAVQSPPRVMRRARAAFARRAADRARVPGLLPTDLCASLRAWQAAGWSDDHEPEEWRRVVEVFNRIHRRDDTAIARGARWLRRHGASRYVADVFRVGGAYDDG